jgi:CRISPR/Cas system CSM-associated protein Csm5 (group 7 of RAMP superfamily)
MRYVLANEETWLEQPRQKGEETSTDETARDRAAEFSRRFDFFDSIAVSRKPRTEERLKVLRREIEKVDGMLKKVDDEIAALAMSEGNSERKGI